MIILTQLQANQVRGLTVVEHALAPKPFVGIGASSPTLNGMLALPEACINDAFHAVHSVFLQTLPTVLDSSIADTDWSIDKTYTAACMYDASWTVGQLIAVNIVPV